jgi:hypothetical protein
LSGHVSGSESSDWSLQGFTLNNFPLATAALSPLAVAFWLRHYATNRMVAGSNDFFFSIYLILPAALRSGVYSASNKNEYQKQKCTYYPYPMDRLYNYWS